MNDIDCFQKLKTNITPRYTQIIRRRSSGGIWIHNTSNKKKTIWTKRLKNSVKQPGYVRIFYLRAIKKMSVRIISFDKKNTRKNLQ